MRARSNSAMPAKTVMTIRPEGLVMSAHILAQVLYQLLELGAVSRGARDFLLEQLFASGRRKALALAFEVLFLGRDPCVPQLYASACLALQNILQLQ
jgi:hypothetical protein